MAAIFVNPEKFLAGGFGQLRKHVTPDHLPGTRQIHRNSGHTRRAGPENFIQHPGKAGKHHARNGVNRQLTGVNPLNAFRGQGAKPAARR